MPVYSMTGYASTLNSAQKNPDETLYKNGDAPSTPEPLVAISIEIRSVNSRFLDLIFRLPDELRGLEPPLRDLFTKKLRRGKVEIRVNTKRLTETAWPQPAAQHLMALSHVEHTIQAWLPNANALSVYEVLQLCRGQGPQLNLDEAAYQVALQACDELCQARAREGARLAELLQQRIVALRQLSVQAEPLVPQAITRQQERFLQRWQAALQLTAGAPALGAEASVPENSQERALNELAAYALRLDIDEELSRLNVHLDEMNRLLEVGGEIGKRLDFLIQELHREANTLGSKSGSLELTQLSVEMKVLIEQMREQVQNIE